MTPGWLPIALMLNNYLHDVATALLAASGVALLGLRAALARGGLDPGHPAAAVSCRFLARLALGSLIWIVIGGIPRAIYFSRYEWWDAAGKGILAALAIKHLILFGMVGIGIALWADLRRRIGGGLGERKDRY